ncbi:MAG: glutamyl-tRNA reductase [Acidobacteria bacterium]|nr:glutamyl-tRNA reductase [Acidobacteriota bacterium]
MNLVLLGLNHRTTPVEVREQFHIPETELGRAVRLLSRHPGVLECMILSTCNRVEFFAHTQDGAEPGGHLRDFVADYYQKEFSGIDSYFYCHKQVESIRHMFRVASSLDSMVLGEPQILGQVKQAFQTAQDAGALNGLLRDVMNQTLAVARKVRRETAIGSSAVSISSAAVELARKIFGDLRKRTIFIIGAGKMSELAAKNLLRSGASTILVSNRTYERAVEMAQLFQGTAIRFEELLENIPRADIVISSTGAPHFVIRKPEMERLLAARKNRPIFLIDIAVPRDIDPRVNELDNVFLYDIDDLEHVIEANRRQRKQEAQWAEQMVSREVDQTIRRLASREVTPTIVALGEHLNRIRAEEMERMKGSLAGLSPDEQQAVEALTQGMIKKILHGPITELKGAAGKPDRNDLVHLVKKLFGLAH